MSSKAHDDDDDNVPKTKQQFVLNTATVIQVVLNCSLSTVATKSS